MKQRLIQIFIVLFLIAFVWAIGFMLLQITGEYDHNVLTIIFLSLMVGSIPAILILGFGFIIIKSIYRFLTWLFTGKAKGSSIMDDFDASDRSLL